MQNKITVKFAFPTLIFVASLALLGKPLCLIPLAAAFLHELGHLALMLLCGQPIKNITVLPFGIDIKKSPRLSSYKTDIAVSSAGIIVNIASLLFCRFLPENAAAELFKQSNMLLILINVLPIKSLDGGQILEKMLLLVMSPEAVENILTFLSMLCIIIVGSVAVWVLFVSGYNFTLLFMCIYLFIGQFLRKADKVL
ncbi:MAG: hypothetical protein IKU48_03030 [Clostridia bacterium]|nr:hypothetical protein [Clostridia bacterium]